MTKPKAKILIVDDEIELMKALCDSLRTNGYDAVGVDNPHAALAALRAGGIDLMLSDLMMPEMDGIELFKQAKQIDHELVGVIMTGQGTIGTAVEAMKQGAYDYLLKPFKIQSVLPLLHRAMEVRHLRRENVRLKHVVRHLEFESPRYQMIGDGLQSVIPMIEKVAATDATVLVRGPSGCGKELVARAIHFNSPRRDRPLVAVNCAALQETLLESELFGHEKGSFTGAATTKEGLFEVAEGGSLFIDEIGEMPMGMQAKMLRVLEDGHFRRVGGTKEFHANVRIIAATNKPLEAEQKAGRFREDLFYRLNVVTINVPPLKDRPGDIPSLVRHFLTTRAVGLKPFEVDPAAMMALSSHDWPGNIRELANAIERAQILAEGNRITVDDLPETIRGHAPQNDHLPPAPDSLDDIERRHVIKVLKDAKGNKQHAAQILGVSRRSLYRLIEKHKLLVEKGERE